MLCRQLVRSFVVGAVIVVRDTWRGGDEQAIHPESTGSDLRVDIVV